MAQLAILDKIERNLKMLGLEIVSRTATTVVVNNASNDFTISLVDASIDSPMGGVSAAAAPFLGIGVAAPCTIKMKSASTAANDITDVMDSLIAAKVLSVLARFGNDLILENVDATFSERIRGHADVLGVGQ